MEESAHRLQIEKQGEFIKEAANEGDERAKEEDEVVEEKDEEVIVTEEDNEEAAVVDSSKDPLPTPKTSLAPPPTILAPPPVVPATAVPEDLSTALMELGDDKRKEVKTKYFDL